ncbi:MAG: undecaprenyl-phosphate glucose phosphotransferase [Thiobacillaceae bacterium]
MVTSNDPPLISVLRRLLDPMVIIGTLFAVVMAHDEQFNGLYLLLGIGSFLISSQVFDEFNMSDPKRWRQARLFSQTRNMFLAWAIVVGLLVLLGHATGLDENIEPDVFRDWVIATPFAMLASHMLTRYYIQRTHLKGNTRRAVIVGAGTLGGRLAQRISNTRSLMISVAGFFEDRADDRRDPEITEPCLGKLSDVASYIKNNNIDLVYITLPMVNQPRILHLVDELRDSTASIYFVPDVFIFDLVQARLDDVNGVPVIAVFESPLTGINAVQKALFDTIMATLILLLIWPILLVIAIAIKLTSPGPVIFKQRRYGMDGEEILVYKFRSMSVCEDGTQIDQASRDDQRITRLGGFLRRTSLDELPQFINVLQTRMSIVGPRPHAVAHNEMYRGLIPGYMWRHKVKPGITGWAQVNGYRGETKALEKMEGRVQYDIDYLRNWSLSLDFYIIIRTILLVLRDRNAF